MKRYCYLNDNYCLQEEKDGIEMYWELNYHSVLNTVLKQHVGDLNGKKSVIDSYAEFQNPYMEVYRDDLDPADRNLYRSLICGVLGSAECELDILNEMYLMCRRKVKKKEHLFFNVKDSTGDIRQEKEAINQTIKNNIKNLKKEQKTRSTIFTFDSEIGTSNKQEIDGFGCEVVRMYLWSKEFRNLFVKTETIYDKYKYADILKILDVGMEKNILTTEPETSIIIEKMLSLSGVREMNYFISNLLSPVNLKNVNDDLSGLENKIIEFTNELWNVPGEYSRTLMIRLIYWELYYAQQYPGRKEKNLKAIDRYIELLKRVKVVFESCYSELVMIMWGEYEKKYPAESLLKILKAKRYQLFQCDMSKPLLEFNEKKRYADKMHYIKQLLQAGNEKDIEAFWRREDMKWKIRPFYTEKENMIKWSECFDGDERYLNLIQQEIIQQNMLKYS